MQRQLEFLYRVHLQTFDGDAIFPDPVGVLLGLVGLQTGTEHVQFDEPCVFGQQW